ncbi:hypothetical protein, partial [Frankia sp. Cr2]|uniref:hypothetical protein n=1 Tax=Frankia sp. Cr2 TaxID=3073932 RepID=UPI002AD27BA8
MSTAARPRAAQAGTAAGALKPLPATVLETLPDGSQLVRVRESDAMLARRRTKTGAVQVLY